MKLGLQSVDPPAWQSAADRRVKYGWGFLRLSALTVVVWACMPAAAQLAAYPPGLAGAARLLAHVYLGAVGALVNAALLPLRASLAALALGGALLVADVVAARDAALIFYLLKTALGDAAAGKVDTDAWRAGLAAVLAAAACVGAALAAGFLPAPPAGAAFFLAALVAAQAACELGDARLERWRFFRHRYAFEVAALCLLAAFRAPLEQRVLLFDLLICAAYRGAGYVLAVFGGGDMSAAAAHLCFQVLGLVRGVRVVRVRDGAVATAVLKASSDKGCGLEALIACAAWQPLLSVESVDVPTWRGMRGELSTLLGALPDERHLAALAARHARASVASGKRVDAAAVARLTAAVMVEYVFGLPWEPRFEVLIDAACEWRAELAVRRRGAARTKSAAVALVLALLRESPRLWPLFGEGWAAPARHSLIMQPFLISPIINVGDVACAAAILLRAAAAAGQPAPDTAEPAFLDACLRKFHPFPIFERYLATEVVVDGVVAVPARSQAVIFASDLQDSTAWPVFGAGPRACAGTHLARPLLHAFLAELPSARDFCPLAGHEHSGRHNDGAASLSEAVYFVRTVAHALFFSRLLERGSRA